MFRVLLISLLFGTEAKITAPEKAPACQFVLIDGSESAGTLTWTVPDREVSVFTSADSKQIVVFSPTAKFCKIRLTAAEGTSRSADAVVVEFVGEMPGPSPAPAPGPAPNPDAKPDVKPPPPGKVLPAGKFGISQKAHEKSLEVECPDRKAETAKVIAALESLQAEFRAGKISPQSPLQISGAINRACLSLPAGQQKRWLPSFGSWWTTTLRDLWDAGRLMTRDDWILLIEETLIGLKAVS
ncbi:MAG: hypothetical protein JWM11_6513 [Planctomycetaceae bacterium]|nr:hypothetical protein [Planctomycetaceae bacterium]